jgi:hypothetical protein
MGAHMENESWVIHRGGQVIDKKARLGEASLSDWERLVYCLWTTDYMMRNAGTLANARDLYPRFQKDAARFAKRLRLSATCETFSLPRQTLQQEYFDRFELICNEIKSAESFNA